MKNLRFFPEALNQNQDWDNVEYYPVKEYVEEEDSFIEQCDKGEEDFWSIYVHVVEGGLCCVADVPTEKDAEDLANLITNLAKYNNVPTDSK